MAQHSQQDTSKKDPFMIAMGLIILLCLSAIFFGNKEAIFKFADGYLKLTPSDVMMIPVGAALFFAFWQIAQRVIFHPYMALVEEREAMTTGATSNATAAVEEAQQLRDEYEAKITNARVEAMGQKLEALERVKEEVKEIITTAENQAQKHLDKSRAAIEAELTATHEAVESEITALVEQIITKVTDAPKEVSTTIN